MHASRIQKTWNHWRQGVRLYIGIGTALLAVEALWWAAAGYSGTELELLRLEEAYAWLSVTYLCAALCIGPAYRLIPTLPGKAIMRDARRLIGVGAGFFALLHVGISYAGVLHWTNLFALTGAYRLALLAGIVAMFILLAMVATSFDAAFKGMGRWWFRLHRSVYAAGVLVVLHTLLIGSHALSWSVGRWTLLAATALIVVLHVLVLRQGRGHEH